MSAGVYKETKGIYFFEIWLFEFQEKDAKSQGVGSVMKVEITKGSKVTEKNSRYKPFPNN